MILKWYTEHIKEDPNHIKDAQKRNIDKSEVFFSHKGWKRIVVRRHQKQEEISYKCNSECIL